MANKTSRGVNFLIYVSEAKEDSKYYLVAGQREGTLTREYDTIDVTSKDNMGWEDMEYGNASWSIEGDGILVEDDKGFKLLEEAFDNAKYVMVRFETQSGNQYEGVTVISDFSIEAPYDDTATYDLTLEGKGAYEKIDEEDVDKGDFDEDPRGDEDQSEDIPEIGDDSEDSGDEDDESGEE